MDDVSAVKIYKPQQYLRGEAPNLLVGEHNALCVDQSI
jgi:hypothetical protein